MKKLIIAVAGLSALISTNAVAQSVLTQNVAFGPTLADVSNVKGVTTNGGVAPFFFFDTTVGTLNSVTFAKTYQFTSQINVINNSATASAGTVRTESGAQFSSDSAGVTQAFNRALNTAGSLTVGGSTLSPVAFDIVGSSSSYSLNPGTSAVFTSSGMSSVTFTDTNAADLAAFSRVGTFSYNPLFSTLTGLQQTNSGGSTSASSVTSLTGLLTISYNFTPLATGGVAGAAPEPATWSMMILGFGLAGTTLRRRRQVTTRVSYAV